MKAVLFTDYGSPDVLRLCEVPTPTPKDDEVLIRVHATPVGFGDLIARDFKKVTLRTFWMPWPLLVPAKLAFGLRKPRITTLGAELAGEVAATGKDVTRFKVGARVIAYRGESMGANAEYVCMKESGVLALAPATLSDAEAACLPYGGAHAVVLLRRLAIHPGQRVLVNGASGSIGSFVVQLAKEAGAHVTGVCGAGRMAMVKGLGADVVLDYTREDFTTGGEQYDVIIDILGKIPFFKGRRALKPGGRYVYISFRMRQVYRHLWTARFGKKKAVCALLITRAADLQALTDLAAAGKIKVPVDRCFPLAETAAAHRYAESGARAGAVVITVGGQ